MASVREKWLKNKPVWNAWAQIGNATTAEVLGCLGYDSITIDCQHGLIDDQMAWNMLAAIRGTGAVPLVRIPANGLATIGKMLDSGAFGIICPMISTAADCRSFVKECMYQPEGIRSYNPTHPQKYDHYANANSEVLKFAMIETKEGVENLDEILRVEELDGIFIGPSDLSISLQVKNAPNPTSQELITTIKHIHDSTCAANKLSGIISYDAMKAKTYANQGFHFISLGSDIVHLKNRMFEILKSVKE